MEAWIGIIGTLLGVSVAGLINHLTNSAKFKREKEWQRKLLIQQKLEEICELIEDIEYSYRNIFAEALTAFRSGELINIKIGLPPLPFSRLNMLINFYAQSLNILYELLEKSRINYGRIIIYIIDLPLKSESTRKDIKNIYLLAHKNINDILKALANKSAELAQELSRK